MGKKPIQKLKKLGYILYINRSGKKGYINWDKVGFLFRTSLEASEYRVKHYNAIEKWQISAVRVPV